MYMYLAFQCTTKKQNDPLSNFLCPTPSWIDNLYHSELTQWLNPWVTACIDSPKRESFRDCLYRFTNRSFCYSLKFIPLSRNIYMNTIKSDIFQDGLTLLELNICYTENLKQFKLRLAALGMQWNQFYSWGGQCLWIFKNVLVRWDVISWVTVLLHYNEGQFIVFRGSS